MGCFGAIDYTEQANFPVYVTSALKDCKETELGETTPVTTTTTIVKKKKTVEPFTLDVKRLCVCECVCKVEREREG